MFMPNFFIALVISLFFTIILGLRYKRIGPWARIESFFVILFLATWGVGLWITPFGPVIFGVHWLTFLILGTIFAMLLASHPASPPRSVNEAAQRAKEQAGIETTVNIFFWFLVVLLIIVIVTWYLHPIPVYGD